MKTITAAILLLGSLALTAFGQATGGGGKKPFPPATETFQIPSHGAKLNALVYIAEGPGPHPVVVLLHGFPGNERNLDLAQDMRRAGWDVLYFNYRGSWGTPGDFSFSHGIEDVASAVAYLRQPENAKRLRLDPNRVILVGHSMGGFMAIQAGAADPTIMAVGVMSASDIAGRVPVPLPENGEAAFVKRYSAALENEGMAPLAGCTSVGLAQEAFDNATHWTFASKADALRTRPVLIVTSDDGYAPLNDAFTAALRKAGNNRVTTTHFATDHAYSDKRLELSAAVRKWLQSIVEK